MIHISKHNPAFFICLLFLISIGRNQLISAESNSVVDMALEAYQEERFDDALLLLKKYKADRSPKDAWLRMRVAIALADWKSPWLHGDLKLEEQDRSWRGALAQCLAEAAFHQEQHDKALKLFRYALRSGGKYLHEASVLRYLVKLSQLQGAKQNAEQYARLLWYGRYDKNDRIFGGILYAQLIHETNAAEARDVVSAIRIMPQLTAEQLVQSHILLIKLLLPDQPIYAEQVALSAMQRLEQAPSGKDDKNQARMDLGLHHVLAVLHASPRRALELAAIYEIEDDPKLRKVREQLAADLFQVLEHAKTCLAEGNKNQALELLEPYRAQDLTALLLSVEAGYPVANALKSSLVQQSHAALQVLAMTTETESALRQAFLRERLAVLGQLNVLNASDISLMLLALHEGLASPEQVRRFEEQILPFHGQHEALGMYLARKAERLQQQRSSMSQHYWQRAFRRLPSTHPWSALAAESFALQVLRPLPPGSVIADLDPDLEQELTTLVEQLSRVAWIGEEQGHLGCRYLLGQALSQLGRLGQARMCFESLIPHANQSRKSRLQNALDRISRSSVKSP